MMSRADLSWLNPHEPCHVIVFSRGSCREGRNKRVENALISPPLMGHRTLLQCGWLRDASPTEDAAYDRHQPMSGDDV